MTSVDVVIMAAGKGVRMKSRLPKVLHRLAGRALLQHVLVAVDALSARRVVVVTGNGAEQVEAAVAAWREPGVPGPVFVRQEPQLGTGHAVQQAVPGRTEQQDQQRPQPGMLPVLKAMHLGQHFATVHCRRAPCGDGGSVARSSIS